jgi:hypothetical protein
MNMLQQIQHRRFIVLDDKQLSSACKWYVLASQRINPLDMEQNSIIKRPWCVRT